MNKVPHKVFFSWASDSKETRNIIEQILKSITASLSLDDINIEITTSIRELKGAGHVPTNIIKNIEESDFFIADTTIINDQGGRLCPNPNVMYELGYAVALLGWGRILLLFDTKNHKIEDLPFDIRGHLTLGIVCNNANFSQSVGDCTKSIGVAFKRLIDDRTPLPVTRNIDQRRLRDVATLELFLSNIC